MPETQADRSAPPILPGILDRIVATKRSEIEALRPRAAELEESAAAAPEVRDFHGALAAGAHVSLIAEVKRRSPGAGAIRPDMDPPELARSYERAGAAALSVLTDTDYFGGSLDDLARIREAVSIPLLRKDFTLHPLQVTEARAAGADAILLIVRLLEDGPLRELRLRAEALGMAALVEAHTAPEVERALDSGARIVGVNNRDLATFSTRLERSLELRKLVPSEVLFVSESGIRTGDDVARLGAAGTDAVLVGEALLKAPDPGVKAGELAGHPRRRAP